MRNGKSTQTIPWVFPSLTNFMTSFLCQVLHHLRVILPRHSTNAVNSIPCVDSWKGRNASVFVFCNTSLLYSWFTFRRFPVLAGLVHLPIKWKQTETYHPSNSHRVCLKPRCTLQPLWCETAWRMNKKQQNNKERNKTLHDGQQWKTTWDKFFERKKKSQYISVVTSNNPLLASKALDF